MKLYDACKCTNHPMTDTVEDAYYYAFSNHLNLFPHSEIPKQWDELKADYDKVADKKMLAIDYIKECVA